jgi:CBS domain-containing protein
MQGRGESAPYSINGDPLGIVTDRDLRGRVLAAGLGPNTSSPVMSRPLVTIDSDAPAFAALRLMIEENIHHLPITEEGKIIGVVSATTYCWLQQQNPLYLRGIIDKWDETAEG